jgi:predicted DCC family thiol-disulfide oxidoreductase YuxK
MCHAWVKRIIRWDRKKIFRFSPLEGELAKETLTPLLPEFIKEDTIIYFENGRVFLRSDAAIQIFRSLDFPYCLGAVGWVFPRTVRDGVYRWIAGRRYRYGKRYQECPLPPVDWRDRFI